MAGIAELINDATTENTYYTHVEVKFIIDFINELETDKLNVFATESVEEAMNKYDALYKRMLTDHGAPARPGDIEMGNPHFLDSKETTNFLGKHTSTSNNSWNIFKPRDYYNNTTVDHLIRILGPLSSSLATAAGVATIFNSGPVRLGFMATGAGLGTSAILSIVRGSSLDNQLKLNKQFASSLKKISKARIDMEAKFRKLVIKIRNDLGSHPLSAEGLKKRRTLLKDLYIFNSQEDLKAFIDQDMTRQNFTEGNFRAKFFVNNNDWSVRFGSYAQNFNKRNITALDGLL